MQSDGYSAFASLASTQLSHVLTKALMAEVWTASPNKCAKGSPVLFLFENGGFENHFQLYNLEIPYVPNMVNTPCHILDISHYFKINKLEHSII